MIAILVMGCGGLPDEEEIAAVRAIDINGFTGYPVHL
jgi:hypothetical protein